MHRLIMKAEKDQIVDHINGNKLDNRKANLRFVTKQQNCMNSKIKSKRKKYKGIYRLENSNKWRARIMLNGKYIQLGYFETEQEAAREYNVAAYIYFGEYARLNKIN